MFGGIFSNQRNFTNYKNMISKKKQKKFCTLILGALFVKSKHIQRICEGFHTFCPSFHRFDRNFTKSKVLGVRLHPRLLHQWIKGNAFFDRFLDFSAVLLHSSKLRSNFQQDVVIGTLTVRENLWFSANLRLPRSVSRDGKRKRIEEILYDLGLTCCADTKVDIRFTETRVYKDAASTYRVQPRNINPHFVVCKQSCIRLDLLRNTDSLRIWQKAPL